MDVQFFPFFSCGSLKSRRTSKIVCAKARQSRQSSHPFHAGYPMSNGASFVFFKSQVLTSGWD